MQKIQILLEFINQYEQLLFLGYLLLSFIAAIVIDKIFILGVKRIVTKSKTDIDDKLVEALIESETLNQEEFNQIAGLKSKPLNEGFNILGFSSILSKKS